MLMDQIDMANPGKKKSAKKPDASDMKLDKNDDNSNRWIRLTFDQMILQAELQWGPTLSVIIPSDLMKLGTEASVFPILVTFPVTFWFQLVFPLSYEFFG